jgi:hypothetical protein
VQQLPLLLLLLLLSLLQLAVGYSEHPQYVSIDCFYKVLF